MIDERGPDSREFASFPEHRAPAELPLAPEPPKRRRPRRGATMSAHTSGGLYGARKSDYAGRLFIVEGIDGSGKSTQLTLLAQWLRGQGYPVVFSEWNSSPIVKSTTSRGKKKRLLTPLTFSLIH